jgi:hypothetical protein
MKTMIKSTAIALAAVLGMTLAASAQDAKLPPASTKTGVTYATDIKPIFDASCVKCHSSTKKNPGGGLALDTLAGTLKGTYSRSSGAFTPVVIPGKSDKSGLVLSVAHIGDDMIFMPKAPRGQTATPLTPEQIGLIRAWIDQGAK